ncbi:MAG: carbohydrate kinase family protein [Methanothrix sp.]|nr:carbohydrate kinase family protein [Methanothrix sp.]
MSIQKSSSNHKGVLVVGGIIIDLILRSDEFKVIDGNICFPFDSKITLQELKEDIGGSAHNVAANLAELGTSTYILGSVGKGDYGEKALKNLRVHGVNTKYVTLKEGSTGMSLVFLVNGEKTVLTNRGANEFLGEKDLNPEVVEKIDTLILTSLISSDNISLMKNAIKEAKKRNVSIVMNPSMSMVTHRPDELKYAMKNSEAIIMNGKESCLITGEKDVESAIKELKKYGAKIVIITQDVKGSLIAENGEIIRVPSYNVKVVDTTGGGDSYTAGFVHAKFRGYSTEDAVKFAGAVAALNISTPGASTDLPTEKDVIEFMKTAEYLKA